MDAAGDIGQYTPLAPDIARHPHVSYFDSANGDLKYARATPLLAVPGGTALPTDTDADLSDDVNGNDRRDFADVVLYFDQMTWISGNEPLEPFDYNANGRIDFADVVWLFNNI